MGALLPAVPLFLARRALVHAGRALRRAGAQRPGGATDWRVAAEGEAWVAIATLRPLPPSAVRNALWDEALGVVASAKDGRMGA